MVLAAEIVKYLLNMLSVLSLSSIIDNLSILGMRGM